MGRLKRWWTCFCEITMVWGILFLLISPIVLWMGADDPEPLLTKIKYIAIICVGVPLFMGLWGTIFMPREWWKP